MSVWWGFTDKLPHLPPHVIMFAITLMACKVLHSVLCICLTRLCWCSPAGMSLNFTPISSIKACKLVAVNSFPQSMMTQLDQLSSQLSTLCMAATNVVAPQVQIGLVASRRLKPSMTMKMYPYSLLILVTGPNRSMYTSSCSPWTGDGRSACVG